MAIDNSTISGILSVVGGSVSAILGYLLGGARERGIDRRRQNYAAKLDEFRRLNSALDTLAAAYFVLPKYSGLDLTDGKGSPLPAVRELQWKNNEFLLNAPSLTENMGIGKSELLELRPELASQEGDEAFAIRVRRVHLKQCTRVMAKGGFERGRLISDIGLTCETEAIHRMAFDLELLVGNVIEKIEDATERGVAPPKITSFQDMSSVVICIQDAMRFDLQMTMNGWYGQRRLSGQLIKRVKSVEPILKAIEAEANARFMDPNKRLMLGLGS